MCKRIEGRPLAGFISKLFSRPKNQLLKLKLKDDEGNDRRRIRRGGKKNKEKRRIKNKE